MVTFHGDFPPFPQGIGNSATVDPLHNCTVLLLYVTLGLLDNIVIIIYIEWDFPKHLRVALDLPVMLPGRKLTVH